MYFALAQIVFACWTWCFANFQVPCVKAMREYVPLGNPYTGSFHFRGMLLSSMVAAFLISLVAGVDHSWHALFLIPIFVSIYKVFFDGIIGSEVYEDFFYLGTTAKQDRWLNTHFPHDRPGEVKVFVCVILFLLFNITNYLLP